MMNFEAKIRDQIINIELPEDSNIVRFDDEKKSYQFKQQQNGRYLLRMGTKLFKIDNISRDKHTVIFTINGNWCSVDVRDEQDLLLDRLGFKTADEAVAGQLNAPMPGKILEIMVNKGDEVSVGQPVAILEAMKMENELKAPVKGVVTSVTASGGDSLEKNALILEIESRG